MALQNGFKILNVQIIDGGGGFAGSTTYTLSFRDRVGNGSDAAGTVTTNSAGKIVTSSISNRGKNYSSGSWEGLANNTGTPAIKGNFTTIGILDAPGSGAVLLPQIGMDVSMSISDINVERGFSATTANSDIHDLYNDFAQEKINLSYKTKNTKLLKILDKLKNNKLYNNKKIRSLVRLSGTEPLVRILVEGQEVAEVKKKSLEIKKLVRPYLG